MQTRKFWQMDHLSDAELAGALSGLLGSERRHVALVVAHLAEVEERRLHLRAACSSLFDYAVRRLGFSEGEAFRRVTAARLARRYPSMFELLASGALHLCAACLLRDYLTAENHSELLHEACGKTKRQVEELLARHFPRPDVPSRIRKLPERSRHLQRPVSAAAPEVFASRAALSATETLARGAVLSSPEALASTATLASPVTSDTRAVAGPASSAVSKSAHGSVRGRVRSDIRPLSESRYRIQLNASASLKQKLELAQALTRHRNPSGDLAEVIERAMDLLLEEIDRTRFGSAKRPQRSPAQAANGSAERAASAARERAPSAGAESGAAMSRAASSQTTVGESNPTGGVDGDCEPVDSEHGRAADAENAQVSAAHAVAVNARSARRSRHIPNACRRDVVARDGLACSYVDAQGNRCGAGGFLELHHDAPWARGGANDAANVRVLCRSHNRLLAEQDFGRRHVRVAIEQARAASMLFKP